METSTVKLNVQTAKEGDALKFTANGETYVLYPVTARVGEIEITFYPNGRQFIGPRESQIVICK